MPIVQALISHDKLFNESETKIVLNELKFTDLTDFKEKIYTIYDKEISLIPTCNCGYLKGEYVKDKVCPKCHTKVLSVYDNLLPIFWVRKFDDDLPFVNPKFWAMLSKLIYKKYDALRYLADTYYNPKQKPPVFEMLKLIIGGRSYRNLINNIDKIINYLLNNSTYKNKHQKLQNLLNLYNKNKDKIFSNYLPLHNKKLFVMERNIKGDFTSSVVSEAVDIAVDIVFTINNLSTDKRKLENKTAQLISGITNLFYNYVNEFVGKKGGLVRRNIYGTRSHFTFRYVASSLRSTYDYNTIHVPWEVGPIVFRPHLLNKLLKRGFSLKEAQKYLDGAVTRYDKLIDDLLKELIEESPYKGIPVLVNRNPSLGKGSIHRVFITRFKEDVAETSVNISTMIATSLNLDFDGDELNFTVLLDNKLADKAEVFAPYNDLPDIGSVFKISGNLNIPKTSILTIASYRDTKEPEAEVDPVFEKLLKMENPQSLHKGNGLHLEEKDIIKDDLKKRRKGTK